MQHVIVFSYIFTILIGVSAFTIQWLSGRSETNDNASVVKHFISMLLVLNVFDFVVYYMDNIVNRPSGNLMLSFGDCLLVIGSAAIILQGKKGGEEFQTLAYKGLITFFLTCNYVTYLVSESGLLLSTGKNIMDITIFFWLVINAANLVILYKKDFVESFLKEDAASIGSYYKIIGDMERIGDHALNIAEEYNVIA